MQPLHECLFVAMMVYPLGHLRLFAAFPLVVDSPRQIHLRLEIVPFTVPRRHLAARGRIAFPRPAFPIRLPRSSFPGQTADF